MKCAFIVQNNGYCIKRKDENRKKVKSFFQVFSDINDN